MYLFSQSIVSARTLMLDTYENHRTHIVAQQPTRTSLPFKRERLILLSTVHLRLRATSSPQSLRPQTTRHPQPQVLRSACAHLRYHLAIRYVDLVTTNCCTYPMVARLSPAPLTHMANAWRANALAYYESQSNVKSILRLNRVRSWRTRLG